jgi:dTDP-4-dehydrorhamnose reductase
MVVLVTGANGQLGQSIQSIAEKFPDIEFVFCDSNKLDITDYDNVNAVFDEFIPKYCINAAAYTAVDRAESEPQKAYSINVLGTQNLAKVCKINSTILLHISTDFVFDGTKKTPYTETDEPNPTGVYGQTKLDGEDAIQELWEKHYIVRTSWVYSQFGSNFMKTMLRLGKEREDLSVVNDQIGTPTNAIDLAKTLIKICLTNNQQPTTNNFGIYNFSNEGQCSWYDFAQKIFEINNITIDLHPIPTKDYPTPAKRPAYSVLDKNKINRVFGVEIDSWETSLEKIS